MASRRSVERQLRKVGKRLERAREDLSQSRVQLDQLAYEADDAETRSIVSDDGNYTRAATDAGRHRDRLTSHCERLQEEIVELELRQDQLLDDLGAAG